MTTTIETTAFIGSFLLLIGVLVFYWQSKPDYKRYKVEKRRRKQIDPTEDIYLN